jgi:hypothetical protein
MGRLGCPIVSVGSGSGEAESEMSKYAEIICIDPDPGSYCNKVVLQPDYATVEDMLRVMETRGLETRGLEPRERTYALLLIRPQPNCTYDITALKLLPLRHICILYRADGGDGSDQLHTFLSRYGLPSNNDMYARHRQRSLALVASCKSHAEITEDGENVTIPTFAVISRQYRFKSLRTGVRDIEVIRKAYMQSILITQKRILGDACDFSMGDASNFGTLSDL